MFSASLYVHYSFASFSSQGTLIIPNLTSLLNEDGQWKFPNEFNPENFLNDHGEFIKPEAFIPFCASMRELKKKKPALDSFYHISRGSHRKGVFNQTFVNEVFFMSQVLVCVSERVWLVWSSSL